MYISKFRKKPFFVLFLVLALIFTSLPVSAITFNTVPVNASCSYPCSGYYTGHFDAKVEATNYNSAYYQTSQFRGTLTSGNQFKDQWGIMTLNVYSGGSQIYSVNPGNLYTAANSSYWQRIYSSRLLLKGNNRVDFNFSYILKNSSGTVRERWYPVRRTSNIQ